MHVELVVPALLAAPAATSATSVTAPALELLLARGRRSEAPGTESLSLEDWLGHAFGLEDEAPLAAGALSALASERAPGADFWARADPVHLRPDRDRLLLVPSAGFSLQAAEAEALAAALNKHFAGQLELAVLSPGTWIVRCATPIELRSQAPIELAGRSVDPLLPDKRWHALLNEIQMALYDHPVNTERERRGAPVVNGLWLWGAGRLPASASGPWQSVSADDAVTRGLARLANVRQRSPGAGAALWLERAPEEGRHLVVLDALRGVSALGDDAGAAARLQALERDWFAPLLAALREGRIGMLSIHVPDAAAGYETIRGDLRRFWRRVKPLHAFR
jgi:hypothetical protein